MKYPNNYSIHQITSANEAAVGKGNSLLPKRALFCQFSNDGPAGSIKTLIDPHRTGNVSDRVMGNIHAGISKRSWTCSECNDNALSIK